MNRFTINLDRPRELVYSFGAWDLMAQEFGPKQGGSAESFDVLKVGVTAREIPFLIFAGLAEEDPSLTLDQVKAWLTPKIKSGEYTILSLMDLVGRALFAHIGLSQTAGEGEKKTKKSPSPTVPGGKTGGK